VAFGVRCRCRAADAEDALASAWGRIPDAWGRIPDAWDGYRTPGTDRAVLGLVRPIRIDNVRYLGLPTRHRLDLPKTLTEGAGMREMKRLKTGCRPPRP
jgi:hypothetical protein